MSTWLNETWTFCISCSVEGLIASPSSISLLRGFGLTPAPLPALVRCGAVERVGRGLYHVVREGRGKHYLLAVACARSPGSIVCLHSALRVHGIRSRAASAAWLAIPRASRPPRIPHIPLRIVRFGAMAWSLRVRATEIDGALRCRRLRALLA